MYQIIPNETMKRETEIFVKFNFLKFASDFRSKSFFKPSKNSCLKMTLQKKNQIVICKKSFCSDKLTHANVNLQSKAASSQ